VDARQLRLFHHVGQGFKVSTLFYIITCHPIFGMCYFPSLYPYL
jgi:hypothetical protein